MLSVPRKNEQFKTGFTIVELLIVVVVIAILAAITIVSYNGISVRSEGAALQGEIGTFAKKLEIDKVGTGNYPSALALADSGRGIKAADSYSLQYLVGGGEYCLNIISKHNSQLAYFVTQNGMVAAGTCPATSADCFSFTAGTGTIQGYYANEGNNIANPACPRSVSIPNTIGGQSVLAIGNAAFNNRQITSVIMPDSITTMGSGAFANNQITSLTLSKSLTAISSSAFSGSLLVSVTIPDSATSIGTGAFGSNPIKSLVIGNSVTSIGSSAFSYGQLTTLTIPNSVTTINSGAFFANQLTSLTVGNSVATIASGAFGSNPLTTVSIPTATSVGSGAFDSGVTISRY